MTGEERAHDVGLQAERTVLAWRRTALTLAAAAVAGGRLLTPTLGLVALLLSATGVALGVAVGVAARRRYRAVHRSLTSRGDLVEVQHAALPIAGLAAGAAVAGLLALAFVVGPAR